MTRGWQNLARAAAIGASCLGVVIGGVVWASAPDRSVRPVARPGGAVVAVPSDATRGPQVPVYYDAQIRPKPRSSWTRSSVRDAIDAAGQTPVVPPAQDPAPVSTAAASPPRVSTVPVFFNATSRPKPRPWIDRTRPAGSGGLTHAVASAAVDPAPVAPVSEGRVLASTAPVFVSPRPANRPANLQRPTQVAARVPVQTTAPVSAGSQGAICGNPAIRGRTLPAIAGALNGCGIANPVQVTEVGGVRLSTPATMNCETAQALLTWTERGAKPAVGRLGGGIASYRVVAHYSCRTRNSQPGARISEHGKGRAIDIAGIKLNNGIDLTVLTGWKDRTQGPILRGMWRAACGPFGTVLGPDANRFHLDHFHFDTASYRNGSYCR